MISENITIENTGGIHIRPAATFAAQMAVYDAEIRLCCGHREANGKSLLGLVAAQIPCGAQVRVTCDGPDEVEMLERATALIRSRFWEQ